MTDGESVILTPVAATFSLVSNSLTERGCGGLYLRYELRINLSPRSHLVSPLMTLFGGCGGHTPESQSKLQEAKDLSKT